MAGWTSFSQLMETQGMASGQHSAAPSALGYQYQTSYCLFELLRQIDHHDRSDAAISLELYDELHGMKMGQPPQRCIGYRLGLDPEFAAKRILQPLPSRTTQPDHYHL